LLKIAAAGFVGHIIGLGDRHGSNILVDQLTWSALHIDFGDVSIATLVFRSLES
jgi:FKBP12-rapamycin complex-associated protein